MVVVALALSNYVFTTFEHAPAAIPIVIIHNSLSAWGGYRTAAVVGETCRRDREGLMGPGLPLGNLIVVGEEARFK